MIRLLGPLSAGCFALLCGVTVLGADPAGALGDKGRPSLSKSGVTLQDFLGPEVTTAGEQIAALAHLSQAQGKRIAIFARLQSVSLIIRPVNEEAPTLRTQGHPPKPREIKYKTLGPLDAQLGAPADKRAEGRVALFLPTLPAHPSTQVKARYEQRLQEWVDANDHALGESELESLTRNNKAYLAPREDGLVFAAKQGGFVMSRLHDRSYTGDLDLFAILDENDHRTTLARNATLVERMIRDKGIDVMHGVHVDWDTHGDRRSQDIDELIRNKHREGHEALVKVTPDLLVCQVWGPDTRENDDTHKYPCIRGTESGGARSLSDGQREGPRSQPYQPHYRAGASLYVSFAKDGNPQARCYQDVTFKVKIIKVKDSKYFIQREGATEQEDWLFQSFDEHACDQVTVRPLDYEPQLRKGATVWLSTGPADNPDACYRDICQRIRIVDIEGSTYTIEYLDATVTDGRIQPASARGVDHNACKAVTDRPPSHPPSSAP